MNAAKIGHVRLELPIEQHRKIRVAAAHSGLSMARFTRNAALDAARKTLRRARRATKGKADSG